MKRHKLLQVTRHSRVQIFGIANRHGPARELAKPEVCEEPAHRGPHSSRDSSCTSLSCTCTSLFSILLTNSLFSVLTHPPTLLSLFSISCLSYVYSQSLVSLLNITRLSPHLPTRLGLSIWSIRSKIESNRKNQKSKLLKKFDRTELKYSHKPNRKYKIGSVRFEKNQNFKPYFFVQCGSV